MSAIAAACELAVQPLPSDATPIFVNHPACVYIMLFINSEVLICECQVLCVHQN